MGRSRRNTGLTAASARRLPPMSMPRGTPVEMATTKPISTSLPLCRKCSCRRPPAYPSTLICRSACHTSAGLGKYTGGRICVTDVVTYHSTPSSAKVAAPAVKRNAAFPRLCVTSIGAVGEFLELRIAIDHAHVIVGDISRRDWRFRKRSGALHEVGNLRHPPVDVGRALAAIHRLQMRREVEGRTRVELLLHRCLGDCHAADLVKLL